MGSYNSQYEEYYKTLKKRKEGNGFNYLNRRSPSSISEYIGRRIIRDLIGAAVLFFIVIVCKLIVTPQTQAVYNYSKKIVNESYDYKEIYAKLKSLDIKNVNVEEEATDFIEKLKAKITGGKTLKEKIENQFQLPVQGKISSPYGYREDPIDKSKKFHEGIDIDVKENTEVKAVFNGKVKDLGEDSTLGKYIVIDHGEGIETKYGHLNLISVKKDGEVKKGDVIGKSGNTGKSTGPHLHFEFLYMGESKNPQNYIAIK